MTVALWSWCSKVFGRRTGSYTVTPAPRHAGDVSGRAVAHHWCHSSSDAPASPAAAVQKLPCVLSYLDAKGDFDRCTSSTGKCGYYVTRIVAVDNLNRRRRFADGLVGGDISLGHLAAPPSIPKTVISDTGGIFSVRSSRKSAAISENRTLRMTQCTFFTR